jgi:hypothetical protein
MRLRALLLLLAFAVLRPALAAPSPTGRTPRLLWTPEWQDTIQRMRAEGHPWWKLTVSNATKTGTSGQRYGDTGLWAAIVYQATGDVAFANRALLLLRPLLTSTATRGGNWLRSNGAEQALLFDWLYPALSPSDKQLYIAALNRWADEATTNRWSPLFPIRTEDSDQTVGTYFEFAFLAVATMGDNPRADEFINRSYVGGFTATAADRSTLRNAIRQYCEELAAGGVWPESTQYNHGTLSLLVLGVEGLRDRHASDLFSEATDLLPRLALGQLYEITPDLAQPLQWGDTENPRDLRLFQYVTLLGMLQGSLRNLPEGAYLNTLIDDLVAKHGATGYQSAEPWARLMLFYDPYGPKADWRAAARSFFAPGQGLLVAREHDRGASGSLFAAHFRPRQIAVDHQVKYFGDFQLYRRGEWALTHPLAYQGPAGQGEGTNSMLLGGLSAMGDVRRVTGQQSAPDGRYHYIAGTTAGAYYSEPRWMPPPAFVDEWTRSLLYLPGSPSDVLIVHDRVSAGPVAEVDIPKYSSVDRTRILEAASAAKQWILHAPVAPAITDGAYGWRTAGGQEVRLDMLLPRERTTRVIDEDAAWADVYPNPAKSEQKWQLRISPAIDERLVGFLNVIRVSDPAAPAPAAPLLVRSDGGELEGALVSRTGASELLALFPAAGPALHAASLTVRFSTADAADVFMADLAVDQVWAAVLDGQAVPLVRGSGGLALLRVPGAGVHILQLGSAVVPLVQFPVSCLDAAGSRVAFEWEGVSRLELTFSDLAAAQEVARRLALANPSLTAVVEDLSAPGVRRLHRYSAEVAYRLEETPR